jgi:PAS domain S-box-containing protein
MLCLQGETAFPSGNPSARADDLQLPAVVVKLLVESVSDYAIYMLDLDGRAVTWNVGAERIKGYTREEVMGRNVSMFFPPDAQKTGLPERQLAAAARDGRAETEGWLLRKNGSKFWAQVVLTAIHDNDGKLQGFAKVTRYMTAQKTAGTKSSAATLSWSDTASSLETSPTT